MKAKIVSILLLIPLSIFSMDKETIQKMTPDELMAYRLEKGRELNAHINARNATETAALLDDLEMKEVEIEYEAFLGNALKKSSAKVVEVFTSRLPNEFFSSNSSFNLLIKTCHPSCSDRAQKIFLLSQKLHAYDNQKIKEFLEIALWRELSCTNIFSCIPMLVQAGAPMNQCNFHGLTPLAYVIQQANKRRIKEILSQVPQLNFSYRVGNEVKNIFYLARENYERFKIVNKRDKMRDYQAIGKALTLYEGMFSHCALIAKNGLMSKVPKDVAKIIAMHADYSMLD